MPVHRRLRYVVNFWRASVGQFWRAPKSDFSRPPFLSEFCAKTQPDTALILDCASNSNCNDLNEVVLLFPCFSEGVSATSLSPRVIVRPLRSAGEGALGGCSCARRRRHHRA